MENLFHAKSYKFEKTGVKFECDDVKIKELFQRCEALAKENIKQFGDVRVMQEGSNYRGVWLETQPMGGEMYASRDIEVALNNHLIFMKNQRRDGRLPGMITYRMPMEGTAAHYDWMQGDFFTVSAFRMYYWIGKDERYLKCLYRTLKDFDEYLWAYRDSDGDGCLEIWCVWDTGDDNNTRLITRGIHPRENGAFCGEEPPVDYGMLPFESAEYMAYSYSHRIILAEISRILNNGEEQKWRDAAQAVRERVKEYLWDEDRKAVFDRDKNNEMMYTLTLENLKCMYHGLFTQQMADDFIRYHLMNEEEFWTLLPLPNIAANDPLFFVDNELNNLSQENLELVNRTVGLESLHNSWSGAVEGLSVQRSLDALIRYGHFAEAAQIGRKWLDMLSGVDKLVQQYNPKAEKQNPAGKDGYGPTILAALEYITFLYGVDYVCDRLRWGAAKNGCNSEFVQQLFGSEYVLKHEDGIARAFKDGKELFAVSEGVSVETDMDGKLLSLSGMEMGSVNVVLQVQGAEKRFTAVSNETVRF